MAIRAQAQATTSPSRHRIAILGGIPYPSPTGRARKFSVDSVLREDMNETHTNEIQYIDG